MRAISGLAAVALTALLAASGCTNTGGSGSSAGASGAPSASVSAGTSGGVTGSVSPADKQVCADTEKLITDSTRKFGEEVVKALQSGSSTEAQQKGVAAVKTLFAEWARGLREQSGKATNPDLKAALTEYATGLEKVNRQISTANDLSKLQELNTPEIESATDKVSRICG